MKLLFVVFFATWTVKILSCRTVVQNGRLIRQFVERHAEKTVEESLLVGVFWKALQPYGMTTEPAVSALD